MRLTFVTAETSLKPLLLLLTLTTIRLSDFQLLQFLTHGLSCNATCETPVRHLWDTFNRNTRVLHIHLRLHLPTHLNFSPHISTYLHTSPRISTYFQTLPHLSTHLHTSSHLSRHRRELFTRPGNCTVSGKFSSSAIAGLLLDQFVALSPEMIQRQSRLQYRHAVIKR